MANRETLIQKLLLLAAAIATLLLLYAGAGLMVERDRDALSGTGSSLVDWIAPRPALAAEASTFTVDSTGDDADASAGDGSCATSQNACTLRAAIQEANLHSGPDTIAFNIPGSGVQTITLSSGLPSITDKSGATTIDGYTQPGSSANTDPSASNAQIMVQITAPTERSRDGIIITSSGNTIRGLAFFKLRNTITLMGSSASGNNIVGNFVGTDAAGSFASTTTGYPGDGIELRSGANHNSIGGTSSSENTCTAGTAAERNVVSGNPYRGVSLFGEGTEYNCIINNIVGLGPKGDKALPNHKHGIDVNKGASRNQVGGTREGERNVVSGNLTNGVEVSHQPNTVGNKVVGNFIGTDVTGNTGPAYAKNGKAGVHIEDHIVDNEVVDNVIGNNTSAGVLIENHVTGMVVRGNRIGVSLDGSSIPNGSSGVLIITGSSGSHVGPDNVLANNRLGGIRVKDADTDRNTITSNSIYANRSLGLDLDPVAATNPNDVGDIDTGSNEQLNFPVIGRATPQKVAGNTCGGCTVEVFLADGGNGSYGQGKTLLGSATADSGGAFAATVSGVAEGNYVTTTATDAAGNTSEFSLNQVVTTASDTTPPETTVDSGPQGTANSSSARFAFSSSEAGSTFECSLDGAAFSSCTSPKDYTNLADGSHTFEVKATDPDGNADATPASRTWTVDATVPTAQAPTQSFVTGTTLDTSTVPVKLTWSATDSGTGISEYKLQQSTNGGAFTTVPISITSTSNTRQLSPGNTYQFRVQAKDKAGNWSEWATGSAFALNDYQETSGAIAYVGTWTPQTLSSAYGGSVNNATVKGDKAQFSFTGSSVTWVATKSADGGKAEVWIDGAKVNGVDLYSSTEQPRKMIFTKNGLDASQPHTLEVRVLGTKNTASSGTRVDVDAFVVLN